MYNSQIKNKAQHHTHRRVKTDLSFGLDHESIRTPNMPNESFLKSFRVHRQKRSIIGQRIATESSRSRSPSQIHEYNYNKWYIRPEIRMKRSLVPDMKPNQKDIEFAYNKLYEEKTLVEERPFLVNKNQKLKLLDQIPVHNLKLLEQFKRNQEIKKKRVPKIIELFLKKKNSPRVP